MDCTRNVLHPVHASRLACVAGSCTRAAWGHDGQAGGAAGAPGGRRECWREQGECAGGDSCAAGGRPCHRCALQEVKVCVHPAITAHHAPATSSKMGVMPSYSALQLSVGAVDTSRMLHDPVPGIPMRAVSKHAAMAALPTRALPPGGIPPQAGSAPSMARRPRPSCRVFCASAPRPKKHAMHQPASAHAASACAVSACGDGARLSHGRSQRVCLPGA